MLKPSEVQIDRIRLRPLKARPQLLAFVDAYIGPMKVLGIMIVDHPGKPASIEFPDKPAVYPCPHCDRSNPKLNRYCGKCGIRLERPPIEVKPNGYRKLGHSTCHPIDIPTRHVIEDVVLRAYMAKLIGQDTIAMQHHTPRYRSLAEFDDVEDAIRIFPA